VIIKVKPRRIANQLADHHSCMGGDIAFSMVDIVLLAISEWYENGHPFAELIPRGDVSLRIRHVLSKDVEHRGLHCMSPDIVGSRTRSWYQGFTGGLSLPGSRLPLS